MRELDHRGSGGIDIRLLENETDDRVIVAVSDARTRDAFELTVEPYDALKAFQQPIRRCSTKRRVLRRCDPTPLTPAPPASLALPRNRDRHPPREIVAPLITSADESAA